MTYYLAADSTRIEGKRYVRGAELPEQAGADLYERGYAVDDPAHLAKRYVLPISDEQRKRLDGRADEVPHEPVSTVGEVSSEGVNELETSTPVNDSTGGAKTTEQDGARKPATARRK